MKNNLILIIFSVLIGLAIIIFGFYPIYTRKTCLKQAREMADSIANTESELIQKGMDLKVADYNQIRDDRYNQCLAERGISN